MAVWYCEELVAGHVPCCKEELQAATRFLRMYKLALTGKGEYVWSNDHVVDICQFTENLPHVKAFEGRIELEPVHIWWLAAIFGFREKDTGLRWVRSASLWVPRKNAKTTIATSIVLFCGNCENEPGAEVTISAGSEKQAHIPYDAIRATFDKEPELVQQWQIKHTAKYTDFGWNGSKITLATSKAENLDGYNPHMVLAEELHAQSQNVIGVLRTAMGSRRNPLFLTISTAGRDTTAAAYDDWKQNQAVLAGKMKADRLFTVMYCGSGEDSEHRFDHKVIEKLNPMYGIALHKAAIDEEIQEARKSESKLNEFLRTRLNIWSRAAGNLLNAESWDKCADPKLDLEAFKGYPIFVGLDLASRSDLNAAAFLTVVDGTVYTIGRYWMPREAERLEDDRFADAFLGWERDGALIMTPGSYVDQRMILREVLDVLKGHNVKGVGVDDYQANLLAKEIEDEGYPVFIVRKNAKSLTASTEDLIARHKDPKMLQHDGNPVTGWCAGNVVGYWDQNANVLPKKEKPNSRANIDGIDAFIVGNALRLDWEAGVLGVPHDEREVNPYLARGLAGHPE